MRFICMPQTVNKLKQSQPLTLVLLHSLSPAVVCIATRRTRRLGYIPHVRQLSAACYIPNLLNCNTCVLHNNERTMCRCYLLEMIEAKESFPCLTYL